MSMGEKFLEGVSEIRERRKEKKTVRKWRKCNRKHIYKYS